MVPLAAGTLPAAAVAEAAQLTEAATLAAQKVPAVQAAAVGPADSVRRPTHSAPVAAAEVVVVAAHLERRQYQ